MSYVPPLASDTEFVYSIHVLTSFMLKLVIFLAKNKIIC